MDLLVKKVESVELLWEVPMSAHGENNRSAPGGAGTGDSGTRACSTRYLVNANDSFRLLNLRIRQYYLERTRQRLPGKRTL